MYAPRCYNASLDPSLLKATQDDSKCHIKAQSEDQNTQL